MRLHICQDFVKDRCTGQEADGEAGDPDCRLNHGLSSRHSKRLLQMFDLDGKPLAEIKPSLIVSEPRRLNRLRDFRKLVVTAGGLVTRAAGGGGAGVKYDITADRDQESGSDSNAESDTEPEVTVALPGAELGMSDEALALSLAVAEEGGDLTQDEIVALLGFSPAGGAGPCDGGDEVKEKEEEEEDVDDTCVRDLLHTSGDTELHVLNEEKTPEPVDPIPVTPHVSDPVPQTESLSVSEANPGKASSDLESGYGRRRYRWRAIDPQEEYTRICLRELDGLCPHSPEACPEFHHTQPYLWQVCWLGRWLSLDDTVTQSVEDRFSDPSETEYITLVSVTGLWWALVSPDLFFL